MEENTVSLDLEFKRYLQIMRPYLGQLVDENAIKFCNAWILRLSSCREGEKALRNKYIFVLCYQLAKGILDEPFLKFPPADDLPQISEVADSESSSEIECLVIDKNETKTEVLYNNNQSASSDTATKDTDNDSMNRSFTNTYSRDEKSSRTTRKQTILCYTCPEMMKACAAEVCSDLCSKDQDQYEYRANNLIMRLRDIKKQNMILHNELIALKQESKGKVSNISLPKINISTSAYLKSDTTVTQRSLKNKLKAVEEDKQNLIHTLNSLQDQIDNMEEIKGREIEELEAKHKMEIAQIKTCLREENKIVYEEKIEQLKENYERIIQEIKDINTTEIQNLKLAHREVMLELEKLKRDKNEEVEYKDKEIKEKLAHIQKKDIELQEKHVELQEKDKIIQNKDIEITTLKSQLEKEKASFNSMVTKILEKPKEDNIESENVKLRTQELEKRLSKMEKSKAKCIKAYEQRLACLQREKHLAECSLHLQLVRERAQTINEVADENQGELISALDKLEAKYKEIVANMQSVAMERRAQDEISINAIIKAACACGLRNEVTNNYSHMSGKTFTFKHNKEESQSCESEVSGPITRTKNRINGNKSYGDNDTVGGFCLNGEKFNQLLDKVYIPQRDFDLPLKK